MNISDTLRITRLHYRPLLQLGVPVFIGQAALILLGFVDNAMVSHHSLEELSAASFVNNFLNLAIIFSLGFSYGLTPLIAKHNEWRQPKQLAHYLLHSLLLNGFIALIVGGGLWAIQGTLTSFNLPAELVPLAHPYYRIQVLGFVVVMLFNTFKQFNEGMGHTKIPMYITVGGNMLNIVLNYLLIFGKLGCPEWGLYGAGIATLVSRLAMLGAISVVSLRSHIYQPIQQALREVQVSLRKGFLPLLKIGAPTSLQMGLEATSFSIAVIFVGRLGSSALASHQIISTISTLGFMIYYGIGAATSIRVSTVQAQGDLSATRHVASAGFILCLGVAAVLMPLLVLFRKPLVQIFNADDVVAQATYLALLPLCIYQVGDILQVIYANALRGIAHMRPLVPAALLCHVGIAPLAGWIGAFHLGLTTPAWQLAAIWGAFPISLTLLGILLRYFFRRATRVAPVQCS